MSYRSRRGITLLTLLLAVPLLAHAADGCKLNRLAVLSVTMNGLRPTVEAQINGRPALFTLDSGAFWSSITPASAKEYELHVDYGRFPGLYVQGVGGATSAGVTKIKDLTLFNVPLHNFDFIVGGSEPGKGTVGLLGQNLLRIADVEYDLSQGSLTLFKPNNCKHANLVYWAKEGDSYSELEIEETTAREPHTTGKVLLNGAKIRVVFDTGAQTSIVGLRAAASAGVKPGGPGVEPAGYSTGIGRNSVQTWIANFPVLKIGDEEIHNARLRFADLGTFDMLLGDDFFLSHRVLVANSQHKLYFTYNGGPVFALNRRGKGPADAPTAPADPTAAPTASADATAAAQPQTGGDAAPPSDVGTSPANAADIARRGAAFAARRDFEHALQDFNRACELVPDEPSYHFQRATVEFALRQPEPAAKDLDRALSLKPDYVEALVMRAEYRRAKADEGDKESRDGALADLDAVDRLAPKEADVRLTLAMLYSTLDLWAQVITQTDLWIAVHEQDPRAVRAYNERCWARAVLGQELDKALRDCNAGLRRNPHSPLLLARRGVVNLRANRLSDAIADFNEDLKIDPKSPWSLYGRGIAEIREGKNAAGEADIAAAKALAPRLPEFAQKIGVR